MEDYINTIIDDLKYKRDEANDIASSIYSLSTSWGDAVGPIIGGFSLKKIDLLMLENMFLYKIYFGL